MRRTMTRKARFANPPGGQGHSKKALNGEVDGVGAVFGEDLASGSDGRAEGMEEAKDGISQAGKGLRGVLGADPTGVFGEGGIAAPVKVVFDAPMLPVEGEEAVRGGPSVAQAGDGIDDLLAELAGGFPGSVDSADLGSAGPLDVACELAGRGQLALLDPAVPLVDGAGDFEIVRRAIPECLMRRPLTAQRCDQLWGEKRRRRRRRCPPSGVVGWLLS